MTSGIGRTPPGGEVLGAALPDERVSQTEAGRARIEARNGMQSQINELQRMLNTPLGGSDEEILMMVQMQVRDLDLEVSGKLSGMRARTTQTRYLAAALQAINEEVSRAGGNQNEPLNLDKPFKWTDEHGVEHNMNLRTFFAREGITPGEKLSTDNIASLRRTLEDRVAAVRGEGETDQIGLQQIMSRRSQILQITSNIMASRNESRKSIAQNIR